MRWTTAPLDSLLDGMTSGRYSFICGSSYLRQFPGLEQNRKRQPSYTERDWLQRQGKLAELACCLHAAGEPLVHLVLACLYNLEP
jgi:hypothetical protein